MKSFFLCIFLLLNSGVTFADIDIGSKIPYFEATDIDGNKIELKQFKDKYVVLEWFHPLCPFTGKHYKSNNMQNLQKKLADKGVVWISVHTDTRDIPNEKQITDVKSWIKYTGASANIYINDKSAELAILFSAKVTPHMYIINPDGILIYAGAIDDKHSTKIEDISKAKNYVTSALEEAMNGHNVSTPKTKPYGCAVKY